MKKIILGTALVSLFAAPAFANMDAKAWFDKADTNDDNVVTEAEFNASKSDKFDKKDANNDGKLTWAEVEAYKDKHDDKHD